jgi:antitoxin component of MazEF toxin-antitoxin module
MRVKLVRNGRAFAIRIPKLAVERARLREGDLLTVSVRGEGQIGLWREHSMPTLHELVAQITPENRYPEITTFDWPDREDDG